MKYAFVADIHIGNHKRFGGELEAGINTRCRRAIDTLAYAYTVAKERKCGHMIILGDLFDTSKPSPQMIAQVLHASENMMDTAVLVGNHDQQSALEGDHACAPLFPYVDIADTVPLAYDSGDIVLVPFQSGPAVEWLPKQLTKFKQLIDEAHTPRALGLHVGLYDDDSKPFWAGPEALHVEKLAEIMDEYGFNAAFAGDWHTHRRWDFDGKVIMQVGSLCPTGFNDPDYEGHGVAIWDDATNEVEYAEVYGPRFPKLPMFGSKGWLPALKKLKEMAEHQPIYAQIRVSCPEEMVDARLAIAAVPIEGFAIEIDDVVARAEARTAAVVARSADTLEEALSGYVQAMPLPDGVNRDFVLARSSAYLAGS